jgi:hypothetical protein
MKVLEHEQLDPVFEEIDALIRSGRGSEKREYLLFSLPEPSEADLKPTPPVKPAHGSFKPPLDWDDGDRPWSL